MLKNIDKCRGFADLNECVDILNLLKVGSRSFEELKTYFENNIIVVSNLEDTMNLFFELGYIEINDNENKSTYKAKNNNYSAESIVRDILELLIQNKVCELIRIDNCYFINIQQNYYAIRNLLHIGQVISKSNINRLYKIEESYVFNFLKLNKKISKKLFLLELEKQNEYGEKAELYVIELEIERLGHSKKVKHISLEDNNAGYDIMSFLCDESKSYDKFIEVKCYSQSLNKIYLSRNEISVAKKLKDNYFLYLVESSFTQKPIIVQNPYDKIFINKDIIYEKESISYDVKKLISILNLK